MNYEFSEFVPAAGAVRPILMGVGQVGESVCIALVGKSDSSGPWARAVAPKLLSCLPQELAHALVSFGGLVVSDFLEWCNQGRLAEQWQPPIAGLTLCDWIDVEGFDVHDMIRVSMSMAALITSESSDEVRLSNPSATPRPAEESRFLAAVRSEVERFRPALVKGFQRSLSLTGKAASGQIDFVGHHYVTCYAALNPKARAINRVQTASAALWRLARARDAFGFATPAVVELTAWVPPSGLPIYSANDYRVVDETVAELKAQAAKEELDVFPVNDASMACRRLVSIEIEQAPTYS